MDFLISLINASTDAILVAEAATGNIVFANSAANKLFECDLEYLVGKHQTQLHPAEELEFISAKFAEFISSDGYKETRAHIVTQKGKVKSVLITSANLFEANEKKYAAAYFKDISYLDHLNEIAYIQSHVVRRPLANILGASEMLQQDAISPEDKELLLSALQKEAKELDHVIRAINSKTML